MAHPKTYIACEDDRLDAVSKAQRAPQSGKQYGVANAGVWIGMLS